jgi:hypothetical protein
VLAAEHLLDLGGLDLGFDLVETALQIGGDVLAGTGPLEEDAQVGNAPAERVTQLGVVAQAAAALQRALRFLLVLPEIRGGDARLEGRELSGIGGTVKDSSADRRPV